MKYIIVLIIGVLIGIVLSSLLWIKNVLKINEDKKKIDDYYHLFDQWLSNCISGQPIEAYFLKNGYKNIAIYGMKEFGRRLLEGLEGTEINVKYVIDRNLSVIPNGIKGYTPEEILPEVDVIVVTASYYYTEIREQLKNTGYNIVSIDDVVCSKY